MALTDNFNRADGDPGANWTDTHGAGASIATNQLKGDTASEYSGTRYSGSSWNNDQSSQIYFTSLYIGPAVRMSTGPNWYAFFNHGSLQECIGGGVPAEIAMWTGAPENNTLKLAVTGTTLEGFANAVSQGTVVDASLASGVPGVMFYDTAARGDDWEGTGEGGFLAVDDLVVSQLVNLSNTN